MNMLELILTVTFNKGASTLIIKIKTRHLAKRHLILCGVILKVVYVERRILPIMLNVVMLSVVAPLLCTVKANQSKIKCITKYFISNDVTRICIFLHHNDVTRIINFLHHTDVIAVTCNLTTMGVVR